MTSNDCSENTAFSQEPTRVTSGHFGQTGKFVAACAVALMAALTPHPARSQESVGTAQVQGHVRDSSGKLMTNATVSLRLPGAAALRDRADFGIPIQITYTDREGAYRFTTVQEGDYVLLVETTGYIAGIVAPVNVGHKEIKTIDIVLKSAKAAEPQNTAAVTSGKAYPAAPTPEFFDEPQFTVAGVTQATNSGGHGSDTVLRTTEALAKATVSLTKETDGSSTAAKSAATESSLRNAVAREPESFEANRQLGKLLADNGDAKQALPYLEQASRLNPRDPEVHHLLGYVDEKLGNPLEAVREYQRAAELEPSEPHLFDWGTELLTHRALEPATEVFTKGNRTFPRSVRMLVALGVAWYARGSYDQAAQCLVNASDLAPDNPTPYLFLGKMQTIETTPSEGSVERLARFAQLQPDNALANYYYAVSLLKESGRQSASASDNDNNAERSAHVESLLLKAVHLDPKLGAAYLQLGILYSQRTDFSQAIAAYRRAIEVSPELDETSEESHYRLAQAYLRSGDKTRAQEELQLHAELAKKKKQDTERERREILEFVISLRNRNSVSPQP
ncbi:MAG: tetratricopeptide repeat protein [Terriglobales bacterium]|jgi:tetratricopeptide (TPR) repeat protein